MITTIIGLVGGLALSALFWFWLTHHVVPRVSFSPSISRADRKDGIPEYRVKIQNKGRRAIIDINLYCLITFREAPAISATGSKNIVNLHVPMKPKHLLKIGPGKHRIVAIEVDESKLSEVDERFSGHVAHAMREGAEGPLETLLGLGEKGSVSLSILCFDEWSGSRKHFASDRYSVRAIVKGDFNGMEVESPG